jgi:hypothetical protein
MHVGNEQAFAGDCDVGSGGGAWLTLTRKGNDPRLLERLRGQNRIPADRALLAAQWKEEREEVTRRRHGAKRLVVALDIFLQQHDVIAWRAARQPTGCEVVHKARKVALARVHVPRGDRECDRGRCGRRRKDLRPYAGGQQRERRNYRDESRWGARPRNSANTGMPSSTMTKPGQVVAGRYINSTTMITAAATM